MIGNSDDHFRNHGFLLTPRGWTLSPAYDMNPTLNEYQSLLINKSSSKADLALLLQASEDYMIPQSDAQRIIVQVKETVKSWRAMANRLGISQREIEYFAARLDR